MTKKLFLIPFIFASLAHAQAPANSILIGVEPVTITASSAKNSTFMFGAGTKFNTVANPKYPLVVDCSVVAACKLLGGDPVPYTIKSIYAVEQSAAYTVTANGKTITVPALPVATVTPPANTTTTYLFSCTVVIPAGPPPATLPCANGTLVKQP